MRPRAVVARPAAERGHALVILGPTAARAPLSVRPPGPRRADRCDLDLLVTRLRGGGGLRLAGRQLVTVVGGGGEGGDTCRARLRSRDERWTGQSDLLGQAGDPAGNRRARSASAPPTARGPAPVACRFPRSAAVLSPRCWTSQRGHNARPSSAQAAILTARTTTVAVKADRHAEPDRDVGDRKHHEVVPVEILVSCVPDRDGQEHHGRNCHDRGEGPIDALVGTRLNIGQARRRVACLLGDPG